MSTSPTRQDRIRGGLYGALVGDALGVPVEFKDREVRDTDPVTGMRAFGTWNQPAGTWSDDGALLLCTADGLSQGRDYAGVGQMFVEWMREGLWTARGDVFDIGNTTSAALARLHRGAPPLQAGLRDECSNGNGSIMRILPVAWHFADEGPERVAEEARKFSCLTHGHIRSQLCCALYCLVAAELLAGTPAAEAVAAAVDSFRPVLEPHGEEQEKFARVLSPEFAATPREHITGSGYCLHTLEASIWCLLKAPDFSTAVLAAVNLGGDTDTTGCATGGLAGLCFGLDSIPVEWVAALPRQAELEVLARSIAE